MAIGGGVKILVTPEVLKTQADVVKNLANDVQSRFKRMENLMEKTQSYWIGDSGNIHRKKYNKQKDDVDIMIKRLLEHPKDLLIISGNYTLAENANVSEAQSLPEDIIS